MNPDILPRVAPEVAAAVAAGRPVVAFETAVLTHGLPASHNLEVVGEMRAAVVAAGALPASVGVLEGVPVVGLDEAELVVLAAGPARRCSLRDLPGVVAQGEHGGTTLAAAAHLAHRAGIRVLATGGTGGVHRGAPCDISADVSVLGCTPLVVVCSGPRAVLDLRRTVEALETLSVPVVGYGTDRMPAFYWRDSGLAVTARADTPEQVAAMVRARDSLGAAHALLVAVPCPQAAALEADIGEQAAAQAAAEAAGDSQVSGSALTPWLLARMAEITAGRSLEAARAFLVNNARVAATIAVALAGRPGWEGALMAGPPPDVCDPA